MRRGTWTLSISAAVVLVTTVVGVGLGDHGDQYCPRIGKCSPPAHTPVPAAAAGWKGWPGAPAVGSVASSVSGTLVPESGVQYETPAVALATSSDGSRLLTVTDAGAVKEWDLSSGAGTALPDPPGLPNADTFAFSDGVFTVAISPGLTTLAAANDSQVELEDVKSGTVLGNPDVSLGIPAGSAPFAFSPDGKWYAAGDESGDVHLVDVAKRQAQVLTSPEHDAPTGPGFVDSVAFSPDGSMLAVGMESGRIYLWSVGSWQLAGTLSDPAEVTGSRPGVTALAFGEHGALLAAGNYDGNVYLWNLSDSSVAGALPGSPGMTYTNTDQIAFSPDGGLIAASFDDGTTRMWSAATGNRLAVLHDGNTTGNHPIAFGPGGKLLLTADGSYHVTEWKLR